MNKADYFKDPDVIGFINFLCKYLVSEEKLDGRLFDDCTLEDNNTESGHSSDAPNEVCHHVHECWHHYLYLATQTHFCFSSIADATNKYYFPVNNQLVHLLPPHASLTTLHSNTIVLNQLQNNLRGSFASGNNAAILAACNDVLTWGGTEVPVPNNRNELNRIDANYPGGICTYLKDAVAYFSGSHGIACPRSNAGFTKIYSLLMEDFVIYDSRVAAALEALVVLYCGHAHKATVPASLNFRWMGARGGHLRNASRGDLTFTGVNNNHESHANCNLMANWILSAALSSIGGGFNGQAGQIALRHIEAGLFMLGYDLKCDEHPKNII